MTTVAALLTSEPLARASAIF